MKVISKSERQTLVLARRFSSKLRGGDVVALVGELGAGKTIFVRGLAAAFGVREPIRSPTFTLMHLHQVKKRSRQPEIKWLMHVDAYRIKNRRELAAIGFDEYAGRPDTVTVVEWADRVGIVNAAPWLLRFRSLRAPDTRQVRITRRAAPRRRRSVLRPHRA